MNKPTIVAVDPGVNGGIAVFTPSEGTTELHKMPGTDWDVVNLIKDIHLSKGRVVLYLEEPPLFAGKSIPGSAIGKLMWNTGILYGAAIGMGVSSRALAARAKEAAAQKDAQIKAARKG